MYEGIIDQIGRLLIEQTTGIYISDFFIIIFASALFILVPGYVIYVKYKVPFKKIVKLYFTVIYAGIILLFTIFRRNFGSKSGAIYTNLSLGFSRRRIYSRSQMIYCFFNFLLFIPWGIFLSGLRENETCIRVVIMTTLVGFLSSFTIEVLQHLTRTGFFEVTDLLMNTAGTAFGALIGYFFVVIFLERER